MIRNFFRVVHNSAKNLKNLKKLKTTAVINNACSMFSDFQCKLSENIND